MKPKLTWDGGQEVRRPRSLPLSSTETKAFSKETYGSCSDTRNSILLGNVTQMLESLPGATSSAQCAVLDLVGWSHFDGRDAEHWLSSAYSIILKARPLIITSGTVWILAEDRAAHYIKIMADEIFGRDNFVANCIWKDASAGTRAASSLVSPSHIHIFIYAKSKACCRLSKLPRTEDMDARYGNPDQDPRGPWLSGPIQTALLGSEGKQFAKTGKCKYIYAIKGPMGEIFNPPTGSCWRFSKEKFAELDADGRIWWGKGKTNGPKIKRFLSDVGLLTPTSLWIEDGRVGCSSDGLREMQAAGACPVEMARVAPTPEAFMQRILLMATQKGDQVISIHIGSGSLISAAHKMGRHYCAIDSRPEGVRLGVRRAKMAADGDQGGISKAVAWSGGGGFSYPSSFREDFHRCTPSLSAAAAECSAAAGTTALSRPSRGKENEGSMNEKLAKRENKRPKLVQTKLHFRPMSEMGNTQRRAC